MYVSKKKTIVNVMETSNQLVFNVKGNKTNSNEKQDTI